MSHFSVAVHISARDKNLLNSESYLDQVLMPWHEYECTGIQNEYVRQINITADAIDNYLESRDVFVRILPNGKKEYRRSYEFPEEEMKKRPLTEEEKIDINENHHFVYKDNEFRLVRSKENPFGEYEYVSLVPEGYKKASVLICYVENFVDFVKDYYGIDNVIENMDETPETGSYIYKAPDSFFGPFNENATTKDVREKLSGSASVFQYTNPEAKWDWWTIGGRFSFTKKDGKPCDKCQIKDLRTFNPEKREHAEKIWDLIMENKFEGSENEKTAFAMKYCWGITKETLEQYASKEDYLMAYCTWQPYAYVKDGVWHEPGEMGWWACSSSTPESEKQYQEDFNKMIANCNPEDWLVCVDCHI